MSSYMGQSLWDLPQMKPTEEQLMLFVKTMPLLGNVLLNTECEVDL